MSKSAIDAEVNNQIFRKDFPMVLAKRRDLATLSPVRLKGDDNDYLAGQCLARRVSTGIFERWSAVSGATNDSQCVLFQSVLAYEFEASVTGGALAQGIFAGFLKKERLLDYVAGSSLGSGAKEQTDATGLTVVKF